MSLSNKLFEEFKQIKQQQPDRQLLLYSPNLMRHISSNSILLAQFKWCLNNNVEDACYKVLRKHLDDLYGKYEIDLLIRRYKQVRLNENRL